MFKGPNKQSTPEMDAIKLHETRVGQYMKNKKRQSAKKKRDDLFKEYAPKGNLLGRAKRTFYNMEKRRLNK